MRGRMLTVCCLALAVAGCGGGERQDADEPEGEFEVEIVKASFPSDQTIAAESAMRIEVRNAGQDALPNVSVTVETRPDDSGEAAQAFSQDINDPDVADASRPVWIVDQAPSGGETAYTNTWALGELEAGETREFKWKVTAVKAGEYTIDYSVSPGLDGKAVPAGGRTTKGTFQVTVDDEPPDARVGDDGRVIREPAN